MIEQTNAMDCDLLRRLIHYCPETGALTWLERAAADMPHDHARRVFNSKHAGKPALNHIDVHGYPRGNIFGRGFKAHRVAWAIHYGEWPSECIDHINGLRTDNRIANLRVATKAENARNAFRYRSNTSGHSGVSWDAGKGRWVAYIGHGSALTWLGRFADIADAVAARKSAEQRLGYSQRHGTAALTSPAKEGV